MKRKKNKGHRRKKQLADLGLTNRFEEIPKKQFHMMREVFLSHFKIDTGEQTKCRSDDFGGDGVK
jgi:hypothetical protein